MTGIEITLTIIFIQLAVVLLGLLGLMWAVLVLVEYLAPDRRSTP